MKIVDLVNDLTALPIVHSVSTMTDWDIKGTIWGMQLVTMPFLRIYPNGVLSPDSIQVAVEAMGEQNEAVYWWKAIPALLREQTEIPEIREPYYSVPVYINGVQDAYVGWNVLQLTVTVEGEFDKLHVTAVHPETDMIVYRQLLVWIENEVATWKMIEHTV